MGFLQRFEKFSIWKGRYPISREGDNLYKANFPIPNFHLGGTPVKENFIRLREQCIWLTALL